MGRDFVVTNSGNANIGTKKRTVERRVFIGPKAARFIAIIIFGALGLLYLTQSTQGANRSYAVRDLTTQQSQLSEQRDNLQVEASRLQSLNQISQTINAAPAGPDKLQPAGAVSYLPGDNASQK